MPTNYNTAIDVGIQQSFTTLGYRNFENVDGTVQYVCNREGMDFQGTKYHVGDNLPFDTGGPPATSYSASALKDLLQAWEQGWIYPTT